jgi:hypothetical protein
VRLLRRQASTAIDRLEDAKPGLDEALCCVGMRRDRQRGQE